MSSKKAVTLITIIAITCIGIFIVLKKAGFELPAHETHDHSEHMDDHVEHEDEHESSNEEEMHDEHAHEEGVVELSQEEIKEIGLQLVTAKPGTIDIQISVSGEININEDRMAHIVTRVEGVVTNVQKKLGDKVKNGEVIAVVTSRELADSKTAYLATSEKYEMAKLAFEREEKLWKEKISSEQDYLDKKQALTESRIELRSTEQKLHAIGFSENELKEIKTEPEQLLTRFEITAPFEGTIIQKHIVLGELVTTDEPVYIVADLGSVWVDLNIYPKDLSHIKVGQKVAITANSEIPPAESKIAYVGPVVGDQSRTALARIVLPNTSGVYRPGLFVSAQISVEKKDAQVVVPKEAIQTLEGKKCVFVKEEHGFKPSFVEIGLSATNKVEILSGLKSGEEFVTKGAFAIKSKIITATLGSHVGHGH